MSLDRTIAALDRRRSPTPRYAAPARRVRQAGRAGLRLTIAIARTLAVATGCRGDDEAHAGQAAVAGRDDAHGPSVVERVAAPYRVVPVPGGGTVRVQVAIAGDAPRDTSFTVPEPERAACGDTVSSGSVARSGDRLADVVVWLPDVRAGKPLSLERRHELTIARCRMMPRVQVATAGSTVNLRAMDDLALVTQFVRHGATAAPVQIATSEPLSVVPDETVLKAPGQVEALSARLPWARAWFLVFDSPYAAVTGPDGTATLADVPPGRWRVRVWHERFGVRDDSVTVAPNGEATLSVSLTAR